MPQLVVNSEVSQLAIIYRNSFVVATLSRPGSCVTGLSSDERAACRPADALAVIRRTHRAWPSASPARVLPALP